MGANTNTMPGTAMPRQFDSASAGGRPGMGVTPMPVGGAGGFGTPFQPGQPIGVLSGSYGQSNPPTNMGPQINNMTGGPMMQPMQTGGPMQQAAGGCPTCGR